MASFKPGILKEKYLEPEEDMVFSPVTNVNKNKLPPLDQRQITFYRYVSLL
jgi:hypothetical protein